MTNLLVKDPVYITLQDFRDTTTNTDLQTIIDDDLKSIIYKAQLVIDDYIQHYWKPFVDWQEFIFPIDVDWVETYPVDISIATVLIGESIYTSTWDNRNIKVDRMWPQTIEYFDKQKYSSYINEKAKLILDKYKSSFIKNLL